MRKPLSKHLGYARKIYGVFVVHLTATITPLIRLASRGAKTLSLVVERTLIIK